jgi:transcriptional regulator with XRE-family HTH domain
MNIGELIKHRRKVLKITQEQLSEISGVGLYTLRQIELNKSNPTIKTLNKILDTLGYEISINLKNKI